MNWKEVNIKPKEQFGWFAVAILPRNHSGSVEGKNEDLEGDNRWRKKFGFVKAWFNNGEWYEADATGSKTRNITRLVTHWDYLPEVPILTEPFAHTDNWRLNEKQSKEEIMKLAWEQWMDDQKTNPNAVNPHAFTYGFYSAMRFIGII